MNRTEKECREPPRTSLESHMETTVQATPAAIPLMRHRAGDFARVHGAADRIVEKVALAISEAVTNAVKYGAVRGRGEVTMTANVDGENLEIVISDHGRGFQEGISTGLGLGLPIIAEMSADLEISQGPKGTTVRMCFQLGEPS